VSHDQTRDAGKYVCLLSHSWRKLRGDTVQLLPNLGGYVADDERNSSFFAAMQHFALCKLSVEAEFRFDADGRCEKLHFKQQSFAK
jgi:hypothetical protein